MWRCGENRVNAERAPDTLKAYITLRARSHARTPYTHQKLSQTVNQRRHSSLVLTPRLCLCAPEQQTGVSQTGWALNGKKPSLNMSHHVFFVLWNNLKTCLPSLFYYSLCSFVNSATLVSLSHSFSPFLSLCFIISFSNSHTFSTCLSNGGGFREYSLGSLREFSRISSCKNRRLCRAGQPSGVRALFCWHDPFSAFVTPYLPNGGATRPAFVHLGLERHIQARKLFAEDNTQTHRCSISTDISPISLAFYTNRYSRPKYTQSTPHT